MKKLLDVPLILSIIAGYYGIYHMTGGNQLFCVFVSGFGVGLSIMFLILSNKNAVLMSYKRELEKEAISSDQNSAKVKVLESKIEVLEKALENALKK